MCDVSPHLFILRTDGLYGLVELKPLPKLVVDQSNLDAEREERHGFPVEV
jgi:hypothetical protein